MRSIRNYSKKTLQGFCLDCKRMIYVLKFDDEIWCGNDRDRPGHIEEEIKIEPVAPEVIIKVVERIVIQKPFKKPSKKKQVHKHGLKKMHSDELKKESSCQICGSEDRLVIDHCHSSSAIRGVLCSNCNSGLGFFTDSVDKLKAAITYLESEPLYDSPESAIKAISSES